MHSNFKQKNIAFIESNTTGTGRKFLLAAKDHGLTPIFITSNPGKYSFLAEELIQPIVLNTNSNQDVYQYLKNISNLQAIFSTSEYYIGSASSLARDLGLLYNSPEAINLCRNKYLLAGKLRQYNINCPKTIKIDSAEQINSIENNFCFPVVVKPVKGSGSVGVKLCFNKQEVFAHAKLLFNDDNLESRCVVIQEYIAGEEYSVETLSFNQQINIIGITKKYLGEPPFFLEVGHDFPAQLSKDLTKKIEELVSNSCHKLGLLCGPAHTEIKIKNDIPYIIEINPRLAGGMIPEIINQATGIDLITQTINLLIGEKVNLTKKNQQFSAIRFIVPKNNGTIKSIKLNHDKHKYQLVDFKINKHINDVVVLRGDFRDRLGHIIVKADTLYACQQLAERSIGSVLLEIEPNQIITEQNINTGRLKDVLLPEIQELINKNNIVDDTIKELEILADIDEAHIMMLLITNNIDSNKAKMLLQEITTLKTDNFDPVKNNNAPRGIYLLYENYLIQKLGINVAGDVHIARSRNDINATKFKLNLRERFIHIYQKVWQLRSILVNLSKSHVKTSIPIYSQYQTALPGTLGHYLLGIEAGLTREQSALQAIYTDLEISPLGAGAGGGTSFAINPEITAKFLGFSSCASNSLDAVASRDVSLRMLSILCSCSMLLSRFVEDLQLWSTNEFKLIEFPDYLCGGSSMMPQKKNPYLLEKIKGMLLSMPANYTTCLLIMYKVPFGNSYEISTESLKPINKAYDDFIIIINLLSIIIKNINIKHEHIKKNQLENLTTATYITDLLVRNKYCSFREAHHKIGSIIRDALDAGIDPHAAIYAFCDPIINKLDLDPLNVALQIEYGGGPGFNSTSNQYYRAIDRLNKHGVWLTNKKRELANCYLYRKNKIKEIIAE